MKEFIKAGLVAVGVLASAAHAALPDAVTTEVAGYKTDALAALALIMAAGVAIWGARLLGKKMGWLN